MAYQRCHELQYERYGSAQGLLNAMRDFQRMAPEKLTDNILESILWNKVPVELQQEVKEISGSVQELLQKLLRAESVLAERKRRTSQPRSANRENQNLRHRTGEREQAAGTTEKVGAGTNRRTPTTFRGESSLQNTKCFNCHKKGHLIQGPHHHEELLLILLQAQSRMTGGCGQ